MPQEWADPRYAWLATEWKKSQELPSRDPNEPRPVRGFIIPPTR